MDSEETRKKIERMGELLSKAVAEYKYSLKSIDDFDNPSTKLLAAKEILDKLVLLTYQHKDQLEEENKSNNQ